MKNPDASASGSPAPDAVPADVQRKLDAAHEWLRGRDAVLAARLAMVPVRPGSRVLLAGPDGDGAIKVNPEAILALSPEEVAGAMVGSVLAWSPEALGGPEVRREILERVERIREGLGAA